MCVAVAAALEHPRPRLAQFETACLLHDIGRVGLQPALFGKIWTWAKSQNIPTRPREWRAKFPETPYGRETRTFIQVYKAALTAQGLPLNAEVKDHIDMRLGFARRLQKHLPPVRARVRELGLTWAPWMGRIMLYYYYPEQLEGVSPWTHQLAEILVGCEQLEAYSNHRRGQDYYAREGESFATAFTFLDNLTKEGILSRPVTNTIRRLSREGHFSSILRQARGGRLTSADQRYLQSLAVTG